METPLRPPPKGGTPNTPNTALFARCEAVLEKVKRFIPSGESSLAFEVARLLEELEKLPKPRLEIGRLAEAAAMEAESGLRNNGQLVLPPSDRG